MRFPKPRVIRMLGSDRWRSLNTKLRRVTGVAAAGGSSRPRVAASPGLAVTVTVLLLLIGVPTGTPRNAVEFAIQVSFCLLGGLAVLRPLLAGLALGVMLVVLLVGQMSFLGMAVVALPTAVAVNAIRGHRIPALLFAVWYVGVSIALTARYVHSAIDLARALNFWLVFMFAPLLLGEVIRRLQQRAERERREQAQDAERQRRAIARDLHDTLAYATTTMVMKAEQARLRGGHDPQTLSDLDFIATTGRSAAADLRTMLALLREQETGPDVPPDPAGVLPPSRLEEVIEAQRAKLAAFDFEVNLALNGDPGGVPERVSTVLARVLTEVASNITKHGDPTQAVTVMIDVDSPEIEMVLVNGIRSEAVETGQRGLGLIGLREIVEVEQGRLDSGRVGERWLTHLTVPRERGTGDD